MPDSPGPERIFSLTAEDYETACEVVGRRNNQSIKLEKKNYFKGDYFARKFFFFGGGRGVRYLIQILRS